MVFVADGMRERIERRVRERELDSAPVSNVAELRDLIGENKRLTQEYAEMNFKTFGNLAAGIATALALSALEPV